MTISLLILGFASLVISWLIPSLDPEGGGINVFKTGFIVTAVVCWSLSGVFYFLS